MAKRKRKMTLFDVINTGQPKGMSVRTRVPTYQPTPELPIQKKIAKLLGRKVSAPGENDGPMSAAQELEQMRRDLSAASKPVATVEPVEERSDDDVLPLVAAQVPAKARLYEPPAAEREKPREPMLGARLQPTRVEPATPDLSNRVRALAAMAEAEESHTPGTPRKPISQAVRERWTVFAPKLARAGRGAATITLDGLGAARERVGSLIAANSRYGITAATAVSVIILLGGSFYVGRLLLNRPAPVGVTAVANATDTTGEIPRRPEVMDLSPRANEAIGNVVQRQPDTQLERATPQQPAGEPNSTTGVFGGRNVQMNYVIVQSYRTQAEADATVDVLAKYDVKATTELNLPRWPSGGSDLFSVVSLDGFARMSGNESYTAFLNKVARISDKETGNLLPRRLDPRPYKYVAKP